jgi:ammonia channel protein AmtB
VIQKVFQKYWSLVMACNGAIAGMVAICASADTVWPWAALVIGQ